MLSHRPPRLAAAFSYAWGVPVSPPERDARGPVRRIALARLVSVTGSMAAYTALTYAVYDRTGSTTWVSLAVFSTLAAQGLLMPLGGAVADRFDRRRVMIVSDLAAAALFGLVALADDPLLLVALAFAATIAELPFFPASSAAIPNLAAPDDLAWANGRIAGALATGITVGPVVAGLLVAAVVPSWAFALNALSFVLSALIVSRVHGRFADPARESGSEHGSVLAGLAFVRRTPSLRAIVIAEFVAFSGVGVIVVADAPLADQFDTGAVGYGLLVAVWGAGMIVGAWLAGRLAQAATEPMWLLGGMIITGAGLGVCVFFPWFWLILAFSVLAGAGNGAVTVTRQGVVQRRTPDGVRGRVFAGLEGVGNLSFIGSLAVAGFVVQAIGPQAAYGVGGLVFVVGALLLVPSVLRAGGSLRTTPDPAPPPASAA